MTRKSLIRVSCLVTCAAAAVALGWAAAQAGGPGVALAPAAYAPGDARYMAASELGVSDLLYATVHTEGAGAGRIAQIDFAGSRSPQWVWLRFDGPWNSWTLRAPIASLYYDRARGRLRTDRPLDELRRLAAVDPETSVRTATAIPARSAPASRLMGLRIVGERNDSFGHVHSVRADASGAAEALVVARRFGLFHAKTERYTVPADRVSYLPVTRQLVIHDMPQPRLASLADGAG